MRQLAAALDSSRNEQHQGGSNGKGGNEVNATIKFRQRWQILMIAFSSDGEERQW